MKSSRTAQPAYFCPSLPRCKFDLQIRSKCDERGHSWTPARPSSSLSRDTGSAHNFWPLSRASCCMIIIADPALCVFARARVSVRACACVRGPAGAETSRVLLLLQLWLVCRVLVWHYFPLFGFRRRSICCGKMEFLNLVQSFPLLVWPAAIAPDNISQIYAVHKYFSRAW